MLRYASAAITLFAVASASAQQPAGVPQPGSPQKPGQTTEIRGADQNDPRDRTPGRPGAAPRNPAGPQNREARFAPQSSNFDAHVADCLILGNQEEIAILKFGMERTKNEEIKNLAASMIKDHEKTVSELRQFASRQHANSELTADQSDRRDVAITREARKVNADPAATQNAGGSSDDMSDRMHRLARRAAEQCLVLTKEELSKHEGDEFDKAFLGQQCGAHIGMLAKLKAAGEETSGDLAQSIAKAQDVTKEHKMELEKLMKSLKDK